MSRHRLKHGLDLPLAGDPQLTIEDARPVGQVALLAADHLGLKPGFHVQPGDRVLRGQLLFEDKRQAGVRFTSPATGTVRAVQRGDRRALQSVIVDVAADDGPALQASFAHLQAARQQPVDAEAIRGLLLECGLWTALRTRPYGEIPPVDGQPKALFITATDTQPHAPPPALVLQGRLDDFQRGLRALQTLTTGPVFLCVGRDSPLQPGPGTRATRHEFDGPHPAGTVGWHIHTLYPVSSHRSVWHIGYQDVAAFGHLLGTGELDVHRVIALSGPGVRRPRLLRTRLGASVLALTEGELTEGALRQISGSVLSGRTVSDDGQGYLGRFHQQVTVIPEARASGPRLPGLRAGRGLYSVTRAFLGGGAYALTTSTHGPARPMLPLPLHDTLLPFDTEPALLLRALLAQDAEQVEALGGLALDEEDLALASFVCPSKQDYGVLLRGVLQQLQELGA